MISKNGLALIEKTLQSLAENHVLGAADVEEAIKKLNIVNEKHYRLSECAKAVRTSPQTLRNEIEDGHLAARRLRGCFFITESDLQEYLERCRYRPSKKKRFQTPSPDMTQLATPSGVSLDQ